MEYTWYILLSGNGLSGWRVSATALLPRVWKETTAQWVTPFRKHTIWYNGKTNVTYGETVTKPVENLTSRVGVGEILGTFEYWEDCYFLNSEEEMLSLITRAHAATKHWQ